MREVGLHVADGHRGAEPHDRAVGQLWLERREHLGLEEVGCRGEGGGTSASAARHAASQSESASRSPQLDGGGQGIEGRSRRAAKQQLGSAGGLVPGGVGVEDDLRRLCRPGPQRLGCGHVAHAQQQAGRVLVGEALDAQQHVVVGHHVGAVVRAAAHAGGRLGEQRPAAGRRQARGRLGDRLGDRAAHDRPARLGGDPRGQLLDVVGVGGGGVLAQLGPGAAVGPPLPNPRRRAARARAPAALAGGS